MKKAQFESGYPFEVFHDNVNEVHPLKGIGRVNMLNLCTEILQVQETSNITDQDQENEYGLDVSCNLGSIDIHAASKVKDFGELVDTSIRLLTNVSLMTNIKNVPSVAKANQLMHSVGLRCYKLHGHLVTQEYYHITVLNSPGTIDEGYRGEIGVILINHGKATFHVEKAMRIAQMVIQTVPQVQLVEVEALSETERGELGFGSSGTK
ncbi:Deoxyuridine 5'-triphosphate nucleotidohydrolase [Ureibacillus acetophenoni]